MEEKKEVKKKRPGQRTQSYTLMLTEKEKEELKKIAKSFNVTVADLLRLSVRVFVNLYQPREISLPGAQTAREEPPAKEVSDERGSFNKF